MKPLKSACWALAVLLALLCLPTAGLARTDATPKAAAHSSPKPKMTLDDLVVRGDISLEGLEATSATTLTNADIVDRIYVTPLDIVKLAPGITVSQYKQGGTASAFQMRGFTGCSHGSDAALFLDGVPLNETDGYADTNIIIPLEIERVELVKGPASALYGNYASAGALAFYTYEKGDFKRMRLSYGSFNTADMSGVFAVPDGKLSHVYAFQIYHTDGYRDFSDWDKQNMAARWTYTFNDAWEATLGVRAFNSTWDAPGYIPQQAYDDRPQSAVSNANGGEKKRGDVRADLRYRINDSSKLLFYTWLVQQDFTRWYQNWISPSQAAGDNYGNERFFQREVFGAGLSYNYVGQIFGRETKMVLGLDWMRENENRERWNLLVGQGRTRGSKYEDYEITLFTTALYGELNYQIFKPLRIVLGARYDMYSGEMEDRMPTASYDNSGPKIFSPKAGLIFTVTPGWDVYANYGRGFSLPKGTDLWKRSYLDPAYRTQYEVGMRARPTDWMDFGISLYRLDTTDDFQATLDDPSVYENAGDTRRQGLEAQINVYPIQNLRLHLDYAYIDAEYLDYWDGSTNCEGNSLKGVPEHVINAEVEYRPDQGFGGRLRYRYVSNWYIDSPNTMEADGYHVVDAQVSYRFNQRYRLTLDVINLLDEKYSEYASYTNGERCYSPADPLSVYLTLSIDW